MQATYLLCDAPPEADSNSVVPSALKAAAFRRRDACVHADSEKPPSQQAESGEGRRGPNDGG